jgi:hypothetical protein
MNGDFERTDRGMIKVLSQHFLEGLRKAMINLSQDSLCPRRDSIRTPLEYGCRALQLN